MAPLLTLDEVAALLRVDVQTVRRWCREGRLPATKLGRVWRVRRDDLDKLTGGGDSCDS